MDVNTWDRITRIRQWLEDEAGEQAEKECALLRVLLKSGKESGELSEALHGALGANPQGDSPPPGRTWGGSSRTSP
ncbi:hypothetical protein [Streptomyces sp. NPDC058280]|uniref:hypothetical protein n=1 Tax=Streptomyces sp. NPDC058280 TaxID=3346419 RepID=UPI0036ECDF67